MRATHRLVSFSVSTVPLTRRRVSVEPPEGGSPTVRGIVLHVQEKKMFSIARKNPAAGFSFAVLGPNLCAIVLSLVFARGTFAQEPASPHARAVTPLSELLAE